VASCSATNSKRRGGLSLLLFAGSQETEVRQGDDREVFKAVDQDGNGFLTYQDIEKLSRDMGELMNYHQLNTIMDTASDDGTMRRVPFERFEEVIISGACAQKRSREAAAYTYVYMQVRNMRCFASFNYDSTGNVCSVFHS